VPIQSFAGASSPFPGKEKEGGGERKGIELQSASSSTAGVQPWSGKKKGEKEAWKATSFAGFNFRPKRPCGVRAIPAREERGGKEGYVTPSSLNIGKKVINPTDQEENCQKFPFCSDFPKWKEGGEGERGEKNINS